jgi:hypothetical protein
VWVGGGYGRCGRTLEVDVGIGILLDGLEIVFFVVLVSELDNVAVDVVARRVALQNVSVVAGMLDALPRSVWGAHGGREGAHGVDGLSCMDGGRRGSLGRWRARTGPLT